MIDLHTHTTASDGTLGSKDLVKKAKEVGLSAIAITDHDQVAGVPEALQAGEELGIEVIPGIELSTYWLEENRREFHILGYFIDWQNQKLSEKLEFYQNERIRVAKESLKKLNEIGYKASWEDVLRIAKGSVGKPHISRVCFDNPENKELCLKVFGKIPDVHEFIEQYLLPGKPAYIPKAGFTPQEAIELIAEVGGVPVVGHPCFDIPIGDLKTVRKLKGWGIKGIEAVAPFVTPEQTKPMIEYFLKIAQDFNLVVTGGSDYHGIDGIGAGLGFLEWGMQVEDETLKKLKAVREIR